MIERKVARKQEKAEEVAQTRGWLLLRGLVPSPMLSHAHSSGSKGAQLEPHAAVGRMQVAQRRGWLLPQDLVSSSTLSRARNSGSKRT